MVQVYKPIYSMSEVATVLTTNKNYVYELINSNKLPCLKINNSKKVRGSDLEKFIEGYPVANKGEVNYV